jgi:hypothetical protein
MAKAKKRVAARKKSLKRGKASAKPARKIAAKHAKKAKSKVQRAGTSAKKSAAKKKRPPETAERRQVAEVPVETATSILPGGEPERGEGIGPAGTST